MKGRTNYLCLHRFDRLQEAEAGLPADERRWLAQIAEWAAGDRHRRPRRNRRPAGRPAALDRADRDERAVPRPRVPAVTPTASSRACATAPPTADIVIVNHHLLCADASVRQGGFGEVIPECDLAVIDEAHQLEDVVTQYFGVSVSTHRVDEFVRDAVAGRGRAARRRSRVAVCDRERRRTTCSTRAARPVRHGAARAAAARRRRSRDADAGRARPADRRRQRRAAMPWTRLRRRSSSTDAEISRRPRRHRRARAALRDDLAIVLAADDPAFVHFIEARGRGRLAARRAD